MTFVKNIALQFPRRLVDQPIISRLVKGCDLEFDILQAPVTQEEGLMVLEMKYAPTAVPGSSFAPPPPLNSNRQG